NGRECDMQGAGGAFACDDPALAPTGLVIEVENDRAVRAWAWDREYLVDASRGYKPAAPAELQAMAGIYASEDGWGGSAPVIARDGKLWLNNTGALTSLGNGLWRAGDDEWSPERVRFDGVVDGRPTRLIYSGSPNVRRFS